MCLYFSNSINGIDEDDDVVSAIRISTSFCAKESGRPFNRPIDQCLLLFLYFSCSLATSQGCSHNFANNWNANLCVWWVCVPFFLATQCPFNELSYCKYRFVVRCIKIKINSKQSIETNEPSQYILDEWKRSFSLLELSTVIVRCQSMNRKCLNQIQQGGGFN